MYDLSIVLPVYNEKEILPIVLKEWKKELSHTSVRYQFIVCEDGSTDGTKDLLPVLQKKFSIVLNQKNYRRGYGGAVLDGIAVATSSYILCIDSDGQCDPKDFSAFWNQRKKSQVTIGWRQNRIDAPQRKIFSFLFKTAFLFLYPTTIHDPSAPFVLFQKKDIQHILPYLIFLREGFWWGFVGACVKKNISIQELPMNHRKRLRGDTQVYKPEHIPSIAIRNLLGLVQLKISN